MKKYLGYIIAGVGLLVFLLTFNPIKEALKLPIPAGITDTMITIVSLVLIIVGSFLSYKSRKEQQPSEVPIYHGENVVGFRRLGKK